MKLSKRISKILIVTLVFVFFVAGVFSETKEAEAGTGMGSIDPSAFSALTSIQTVDKGGIMSTLAQTGKDVAAWAKDMAYQEWTWIRDEGIALAYKKALSYFLNQLAYDTATYLATGDKGQSPMFYTESWGDYLGNVADNAAGHFLEELGENGPVAFDLCDPGLDVTAQIGIGIMKTENPDEPDCTYSEMKNNWESELNRPDFLNRFVKIYEPSSNDFGITLSLQSEVMNRKIEEKELNTLNRTLNDGIKDVTEPISDAIKTPGSVVRSYVDDTVEKAGENYFTYTGHILADSIDTFTNTLVAKLLEEWLRDGIARSTEDTSYGGDWGSFSGGGRYSGSSGSYVGQGGASGGSSIANNYTGGGGLSNYEASGSSGGGVSQAREQFQGIIQPNFAVKGDYDALNELVTCADPVNAGPNECVITETTRQAVEQNLSVSQAVEGGYLNANAVFGFRADGLEPTFTEGIPYRSMLILRKYRVIPVGWELAAQYIMENQASLSTTLSLGDMIECFYQGTNPRDRYPGFAESWCEGLVDPSWVLKAPQNFCKREGAGPQIISSQVSGTGDDSKLIVARDDSYCADEQTCIKEGDDGDCELYGYCLEDRRKYNFGGQSCDARYNTCQSFRSTDGRTISLLENTLNYEDCDAENAGCEKYVRPASLGEGDYDAEANRVDWTTVTDEIRLDSSAAVCEEAQEGCHEFIRTKPGLGVNLLTNASFEEYEVGSGFRAWGLMGIGTVTDDSREGFSALELTADMSRSITIDPVDILAGGATYDLEGSIFTLSAYAKNCNAGAELILSGSVDSESVSLEANDDWRFLSLTFVASSSNGNVLTISTNGVISCTLDAMKLERTTPEAEGTPTQYVPYRGVGIVYQKLLPEYMFDECYEDADGDGYLENTANAPSNCDDYVRPCTDREVNCEMYKSATDGFSVPAVVAASDYCPAECVGYDTYIQTETNFEDTETEYFIPATAETCSAQVAGCDEFTNLDETVGSENREYFVHMRRCVSPTTPTCEAYFMWEGSDETGYQLKVHNLNTAGAVVETVTGASGCSVDITNANYDADCREFYDDAGNVTYELYYNTVSCTEDCHPYRRSVVDDPVTELANCSFGGGTWDAANNYCVYMAVPKEGITCAASEASCREYNGNSGANMRTIFEHSFEDGTSMGWTNGINSNASVIVGQHSMEINGPTVKTLGSDLRENRSYVLQFLASGANISSISIENGTDVTMFNNSSFALTASWEAYEVNLASLDHTIDPVNEAIVIDGVGYIDNIRLIEVSDRHYLIENSWEDDCDYIDADPSGTPVPVDGYYAGCDAYIDRDDTVHNLYQFDHLCPEEAVGCELMIDTHNYSDYASSTWFAGTIDEVNVPADSYRYVVYNDEKTCAEQDKGCERMGLEYLYEYTDTYTHVQYFDNYKINNPNDYDVSLCEDNALRCDAWESRNGSTYFKDPNDMVCEYRTESDAGLGTYAWLKKKVKKCDEGSADGEIVSDIALGEELDLCSSAAQCGLVDPSLTPPAWCEADDDCPNSSVCIDNECRYDCIVDEDDWACEVDNDGVTIPKTVGEGGENAMVEQPQGYLEGSMWAGACPSAQDDCTEYIDPISSFSPIVDVLKPYTLYVHESGTIPTCAGTSYYYLNETTNRLDSVGANLFYVYGNECRFNPANGHGIKKAVVDYQVAYSLDRGSCNGMVDLEQGCMLFNERSIDGDDVYTDLDFDADVSHYGTPAAPVAGTNSNTLLKVTPDRECNKWLSCRSFIKDVGDNDVCFDVGACGRLDENGNCSYFYDVAASPINQIYPTLLGSSTIANMTGYSKVSYGAFNAATDTVRNDYYPFGDMTQVGQVANVPNGSFELYDDNKYPLGWTNPNDDNWERDMFRVVNNPVEAQNEGIDYPLDGKSFLKFGARDSVRSELIDLAPDTDYILSFYMNTKNLASGIARVSAPFMSDVTMGASYDWKLHVVPINSNSGRLEFRTDNGDGNVYVDKIEIKPALNSRSEGGRAWNTPQSCRLYPESDSLACEYYDDSGHKKKGWPGYCIEYDRYPGNPESCLLWYPVDRVSGDGYEEGGGYLDRQPLYYCVDTTNVDYGLNSGNAMYEQPTGNPTDMEDMVMSNNFGAETSGDIDISHRNPYGVSFDTWSLEQLGLGNVDEEKLLWSNISHIRVHHTGPSVYCDGNLSQSWDMYYRFDSSSDGDACDDPGDPTIGHWDCTIWGTGLGDGWAGGALAQNDPWYTSIFSGSPGQDTSTYEGGIEILGATSTSFAGIRTSNYDSYCDHPDGQIVEVVIFPEVFFCTDVIQTVTPMGQSKHYSANIYEGSNEAYSCNSSLGDLAYTGYVDAAGNEDPQMCNYMSDLAPFGAVSQPGLEINDWAIMSNPYMWDSKEGVEGNQPLFYEIPNGSMFNNSQARMGQEWSWGTIRSNLFGQYYDSWEFVDDGSSGLGQVTGHYEQTGPSATASGGTSPTVFNININPGSPYENQLVNLTFNSNVDRQHLPMTMVDVNWGDGTKTSASGIEMRDQPETDNPHSMYHIYAQPGSYTITVRVRDNWGLSGGASRGIGVQAR